MRVTYAVDASGVRILDYPSRMFIFDRGLYMCFSCFSVLYILPMVDGGRRWSAVVGADWRLSAVVGGGRWWSSVVGGGRRWLAVVGGALG